ncbi:MAG: hypothetical protein HC897_09290 [Thermoanaerobaculia bacterium]|nr:hypothetical protein [Thermoanaerobaculia bacterium]
MTIRDRLARTTTVYLLLFWAAGFQLGCAARQSGAADDPTSLSTWLWSLLLVFLVLCAAALVLLVVVVLFLLWRAKS